MPAYDHFIDLALFEHGWSTKDGEVSALQVSKTARVSEAVWLPKAWLKDFNWNRESHRITCKISYANAVKKGLS